MDDHESNKDHDHHYHDDIKDHDDRRTKTSTKVGSRSSGPKVISPGTRVMSLTRIRRPKTTVRIMT